MGSMALPAGGRSSGGGIGHDRRLLACPPMAARKVSGCSSARVSYNCSGCKNRPAASRRSTASTSSAAAFSAAAALRSLRGAQPAPAPLPHARAAAPPPGRADIRPVEEGCGLGWVGGGLETAWGGCKRTQHTRRPLRAGQSTPVSIHNLCANPSRCVSPTQPIPDRCWSACGGSPGTASCYGGPGSRSKAQVAVPPPAPAPPRRPAAG